MRKFAQPYAPLLAAGVKFQASLGNHDRPQNVSYPGFNMNGQRYYSFVRGNVRFLALDSTLMDAKQIAWIEATLQGAKEEWKVCFFHHPALLERRPPRIVGRSAAAARTDLPEVRR